MKTKQIIFRFFCCLLIFNMLFYAFTYCFPYNGLIMQNDNTWYSWILKTPLIFRNIGDTFNDFYNTLVVALVKQPYSGLIAIPYTAINLLIMRIFNFTGNETLALQESGLIGNGRILRDNDFLNLSYVTFLLVTFIIIIYSLYKHLKRYQFSIRELILIFLAIILSFPFLYALQRGNIIIFAFACIALYLIWYDSENKYKREVALVLLSVAGVMKLYPFIFGIMLMKNKKVLSKEFIYPLVRIIIYSIIIFLIPYLFIPNGLANIPLFFNNIINYKVLQTSFININGVKERIWFNIGGGNISVFNIAPLLFALLNDGKIFDLPQTLLLVSNIFSIIVIIIYFIAIFLTKKKWETLLIATLLLMSIPSPNYLYSAIFMTFPLLSFLFSERNKKKYQYVLFFLIFVPLPLGMLVSEKFYTTGFFPGISTASVVLIFSSLILGIITSFRIIYEFIGNGEFYGKINRIFK
ncbi:MAG: hypothetical protein RSC93_06415 [Erysipelotrichaceae bacterium]